MSSRDMAYLDTNVLISYSLESGNTNLHDRAYKYLYSSISRGFQLVISYWTLLELYSVIWGGHIETKLLTYRSNEEIDNEELMNYAKNMTKKTIKRIFQDMKGYDVKRLPNKNKIRFDQIWKVIQKGFNGKKLWKSIRKNEETILKPLFVAAPDQLHLHIANNAKCKEFVTFDRDFNIDETDKIFSGNICRI